MGGLSTADLLCLYLAGGQAETEKGGQPGDTAEESTEARESWYTAAAVPDALAAALKRPVSELFAELATRELVERELPAPDEGESQQYRLTDAGRAYAATLREDVLSREIAIRRGNQTVHCELAAVDEHTRPSSELPGDDPVVGALVAMDDSELVLEEPRDRVALVGREQERAVLEELLYPDETRQETHTGIVVAGTTGIGKTALVQSLADRVSEQGGTVLAGTATPGGNEPYGPIREALAATAPTVEEPFDDIAAVRVEADSYDAYRQTLFAEVTARIEELVGEEPALVFLDDLHWADQATLELFASLLSDLDADRTAIVGTYDESLLDEDDRLVEIVDRECAAGRLECLQLSPLTAEQLALLIEQEVGTAPPDAFVAALESFTGGNPLFVGECLRHLLDEDVLDPAAERWPTEFDAVSLPETVDGIVGTRLARLTDETLSVLQSAAAIGERVPLSVLAAVTDRSEPQLREIAETLVSADLWAVAQTVEHPSTRTYRFESTLARRRVLETLSPAARQARHEAVAEALLSVEGHSAQDRHAAVARQYEQAGRISAAIAHYRAAAEHATEVYAHDCAIELLNRAYDLASDHDRETLCHELRLETAKRWYLVGEYDRAVDQVEAVYRGTTDETLLQRALTRLGTIAVAQGAFDRAIRLATEGIERGSEPRSTIVCQLLHIKCMAEWRQGEYTAAMETATEQRQLAERIDDQSLVADAVHDLGTICLQQGAYDEAEGWFEQALSLRRATDDEHGVAKTLGNMGIVAQHQGELDVTVECYEQSLEAFRAVGSQYDVATVLNNLGTIALEGGDLDKAAEYLEESLACFRRLDIRDGIALVLTNKAALARVRGARERARRAHEDGLELARELGSQHLVAENIDGLGLVAAAAGDVHDAREQFERSLEIKRELGVTHGVAQTLSDLATVCREMGARKRATEHLEEAEALAAGVNDPSLLAVCRAKLAGLALERDEQASASQWLDKALAALEGTGTIGTDRARPIEQFDELIAQATAAGYEETARNWCQRVTRLLERRDDVDDDRFDDHQVRTLD